MIFQQSIIYFFFYYTSLKVISKYAIFTNYELKLVIFTNSCILTL